MNSSETITGTQRSTLTGVREFREAALANGYRLVRVHSGGKAPFSQGWQDGEADRLLLEVTPAAANTGIICRGFVVVDVDCDDSKLVSEITEAVRRCLPPGALIRRRAGSPRYAMVFQAEGEPGKRLVSGDLGKVEILGAGQQLLADGIHPSGVSLKWMRGRSPATIPAEALPVVSEAQIDGLLKECAAILRPGCIPSQGNLPPRSDPRGLAKNANDNDLAAGIDRGHWFDHLTAQGKREVIQTSLDAIDNRHDDPREQWLSVLFAVADAETRGCPAAREIALEWSKRGARWTSGDDFDKAWDSFKPGGTTIATLLYKARQAGVDLSPWRSSFVPPPQQQSLSTPASGPTGALGTTQPYRRGAIAVSTLPTVPPKRLWLHGIDAVRGAVSLLVAPGARGKSAWLITLALACASGRSLLGQPIFGGSLRVLYVNAEDSTNEIGLRVRAAMNHHQLTDADVPGLHVAGVDCFRLSLLKAERGQPLLHQPDWDFLAAELDRLKPDLLLIDPLVSLMGGRVGERQFGSGTCPREFCTDRCGT